MPRKMPFLKELTALAPHQDQLHAAPWVKGMCSGGLVRDDRPLVRELGSAIASYFGWFSAYLLGHRCDRLFVGLALRR